MTQGKKLFKHRINLNISLHLLHQNLMRICNIIRYYKLVSDTFAAYAKCLKIFVIPKLFRPQTTHKHLLLLSWAYPPDVTGGVYRPMSIVRAAKRRGWRITIICGHSLEKSSVAGSYLENLVLNAGQVIRLPIPLLKPSYKLFFPKIDGGFLNLLETIELACRELKNDQPSLILASGPPFHNFVAARELSKRFGKRYILDYRDEWTECPFDFVNVGNTDLFFEKKCIQDASKIIFTTTSHRQHQNQCFKIIDETKSTVIPNGWEIEESHTNINEYPLESVKIRLAFVGFLGEHTLPREFLKSLERCISDSPELVNQLRVAFVGNKTSGAISQLHEFEFQQVIEILDFVPKPTALNIMKNADGLILINEPRLNRYRPGKLYDYVSMRTPILVYGGGGEVEDIVTKLQIGIVVTTDKHEELHAALLRLHKIKDNLHSSDIDVWLAKHTRSVLSERIVDLLEEVESNASDR